MKIIFECSHNVSHHYHILPLINYYYDQGHEIFVFTCNAEDRFETEVPITYYDINDLVLPSKFENILCFFKILYKRTIKLDKTAYDYDFLFRKNSRLLSNFDAIIFTDLIDPILIKRYIPAIKVIWAMHGPVNNDFGTSIPYAEVDAILSQGASTTKAYTEGSESVFEIGSLKLQYIESKFYKTEKKLFSNNKPTVVYNPHFRREIKGDSWYKFGEEILNYFKDNSEFNLVFAPHIMLSKFVSFSNIKEIYKDHPNIIIDVDSENLSNLYYAMNSDIYIGDASSQIFEYIALKNRNCILFKEQPFTDSELDVVSMVRCVSNLEEMHEALMDRSNWNETLIQKQKIRNVFSSTRGCAEKAYEIINSQII